MIKRAREGGDVPHHVSLVDVDPDPQRVGDDKSQHYGGEQGLSVFFIEMKLRERKLTAIVESLLWLLLLPFTRGLRATTR